MLQDLEKECVWFRRSRYENGMILRDLCGYNVEWERLFLGLIEVSRFLDKIQRYFGTGFPRFRNTFRRSVFLFFITKNKRIN